MSSSDATPTNNPRQRTPLRSAATAAGWGAFLGALGGFAASPNGPIVLFYIFFSGVAWAILFFFVVLIFQSVRRLAAK